MRRGASRAVTLLSLAFASLWLTAAPAHAASTSYVSPNGPRITTPCPQAEPCYLPVPLAAQEPNDTIILEPGEYQPPPEPALGTTINLLQEGVTLEGEPGKPAPRVFSKVTGGPAVRMEGFGAVLRNVDVEDSGIEDGWPTLLAFNEARIDHVIAHSTKDERLACSGYDLTLTDAVCDGKDGFYVSTGGPIAATISLRNSDLYGTENGMIVAGSGKLELEVNAVNSVIRAGASGHDIESDPMEAAGVVRLDLEHSNFGGIAEEGAGKTVRTGSGNQSASPLFSNASAGDFREAPGSPTIEAGLNSPLNGLTDLAGNPREIGAHTDIGAYEFLIAPTAETGTESGVGLTGATLNGTVNPNGSATSASFRYGTSTAYGSSVTVPSPGAGATPTAVSAALSGLARGATYHYELVASNAQGTSTGIDRTFTTPSAVNKGPVPHLSRPVLSALHISPRSFRTRRGPHAKRPGTTVSYTLSLAGKVGFAIQASRPGRVGHGGRCVAQTHANRHARHCRRTVTFARFSRSGVKGANRFHLTGSGLHPGGYVLAATPQASGRTGTTQKASFSVVH